MSDTQEETIMSLLYTKTPRFSIGFTAQFLLSKCQLQRVFLKLLVHRLSGKLDIDRGRLKASMAQRLLDGS